MPTIWSEQELETLRRVYPTSSRKIILNLLPNKRWTSIRHKAGELKLTKVYRGIWSLTELQTLKENWSAKTKPELLELLNKDWTSIRHKAFELELKKERHRVRYWHTYWGYEDIHLTDRQIGYFAGIIDGEGHIRIVRSIQRTGNYYAPFIGITNTCQPLIDKCMDIFKSGRFHAEKKKRPNHKIKLVYNIASVKGVKQILTQILDELVVKRKQAELVLEFIRLKESKTGYGVLPREIELFEEVKRLNRRGNNGNA